MGEAKRRKKLDPNYGSSNVLKDACQHIDDFLLQQAESDIETVFSLFTNKDRGCTAIELELLQREIPVRYQGNNFSMWILPKKYAHLPVDKALYHLVPINVGKST